MSLRRALCLLAIILIAEPLPAQQPNPTPQRFLSSPGASPSPTPRIPGAPKSMRKRPAPTPLPTPVPTSEDPIPLPFGLAWGDSPETVNVTLPRVNATVRKKTPMGKTGEFWSLAGIKVPGLRDARMYFQDQHLVGVDLEYGDNAWPVEKYNIGMGNLRRRLEQMFVAPGVLVSRGPVQDESTPEVAQVLTGYDWKRFDTVVLLVYYSAEKKQGEEVKDAFRSLLVRYRYRDPVLVTAEAKEKEKAEAAAPTPPPDPGATPTPTAAPTPEVKAKDLPIPKLKGDGTDPLPEE